MPATTGECRARLERIVADSLRAARALEQSLKEERRGLEQQDMDAVHAASEAKRACVTELEGLEERRRCICREAGRSSAPADMPALLAWCGGTAVADEWQQLLEALSAAERLNTANGAIIHLRRERLGAALAIVSGGREDAAGTYDPAGARQGAGFRRALAKI